MNNLLVFFCILFAVNCLGQDCEYAVKEIDAFEKKEIVRTEYVKVMYPSVKYPVVFMAFGRIDSTYTMFVKFSYKELVCFNSAKNELLLMTEDSTVYRFNRIDDAVRCTEKDTYSYIGQEAFEISRSALEELREKKLSKIQLYHSAGFIEADLNQKNLNKKKAAKFLSENIPCILK